MRNPLLLIVALLTAIPLAAQSWSIGAGSGAFVFGDFVERNLRPTTGSGSAGTTTLVLTAKTRPGLALDLEKEFAPRWAVRLEGAFTSSPLAVGQQGEDDSVAIEAGEMDVTTFMLPLVFRINPRGSFRFHLMGGPAYAIYRINGQSNVSGINPVAETRNEWGLAGGGGVAWWVSDRFAIEGNLVDIVTTSPFDSDDFPGTGYAIPRPHNVHTTAGVRWRF